MVDRQQRYAGNKEPQRHQGVSEHCELGKWQVDFISDLLVMAVQRTALNWNMSLLPGSVGKTMLGLIREVCQRHCYGKLPEVTDPRLEHHNNSWVESDWRLPVQIREDSKLDQLFLLKTHMILRFVIILFVDVLIHLLLFLCFSGYWCIPVPLTISLGTVVFHCQHNVALE